MIQLMLLFSWPENSLASLATNDARGGMEWKKYTIQTPDEALGNLLSNSRGLTSAEADRRVLEYGKNAVDTAEFFWSRIFKHRLQSYLFWVFVGAVIVTLLLGNILESICILIFLLLNTALEGYQQFHSEKAAYTLRHFLIPKARAWRDEKLQELASSLLVPGDIIELQAGEIIPADIRFLETEGVETNETLLQVKRGQVFKDNKALPTAPFSPEEASNIGFAGTMMTKGRAKAMVVATGAHTALGGIAYGNSITERETPFEKNIRSFSGFLVKLLLGGLVGIFALYFLIHGEQVAFNNMVIFTLVLAIAVIPESLPALTALALARGSVRLAKKNVIVKRLSAIEDLGSIEVLCIDKTGVLTENHLAVTETWGENPRALLQLALLASHQHPRLREHLRDAFDRALWDRVTPEEQRKIAPLQRFRSLGFDPNTRVQNVVVGEEKHKKEVTLIVRGAPEEVLKRVERLDAYTRRSLQEWIQEAGQRGERVLAVATKTLPQISSGWHAETGLTFTGLISFLDPIKGKMKNTLALAERMGVQVRIFSGDSKEVVGTAGYAAGLLAHREEVITGAEFEALSLPEQIQALETYKAFARFSPFQKAAAVRLMEKSHLVGVVGSGFADTDMLQAAHVAMVTEGEGGISREAADIVLLEKDLQMVVEGIRESRRVFANILKYLKITLASNFGNFYSLTLAAIFLPFLPLLPLQILLLNFLSDIPMLAIATDKVDQEKLERPKDQSIHIIIGTAALFGALSSFFDLTLFKLFSAYSADMMRTSWFVFSVLTEAVLLYSLRSRRWFFQAERPSGWLMGLSVVAVGLAFMVPYTTFGAFLGFQSLSVATVIIILAFTASYFVATELIKRWYYQHFSLFHPKR